MHIVKMKGKTAEEATKSALEVLKTTKDKVNIKVLDEGESGVLGVFGGRDAEVEVSVKQNEEEAAKALVEEMLDKMNFIAQVYIESFNDDNICLDIKSDDISRIIGKEGATIDAIQYLSNIMLNKGKEKRTRIIVDAGGYRKKQDRKIEKIAQEAIDEVIISKKPITLPPMNARERRIAHMIIKSDPKVTSHSEGEGKDRSVIISPKE